MATDPQLQALLDKAARLKRRIDKYDAGKKELSRRLDSIKAEIASLVPEAPSVQEAASKTRGGGTSWTLSAVGGATIRVTQPAAKLLSKISGDLIDQLKKLCGRKFGKLFIPHFTCEKDFRRLAFQELPDKAAAEAAIKLCEEPSVATVTIT